MKTQRRPPGMLRTPMLVLALALVCVLGACASVPAPTSQIAVADAAIKHARASNAGQGASTELALAISKLEQARQAESSKDYERASQLAEQAELDARVAELSAQAGRSRVTAEESRNAASALREEINRKTLR